MISSLWWTKAIFFKAAAAAADIPKSVGETLGSPVWVLIQDFPTLSIQKIVSLLEDYQPKDLKKQLFEWGKNRALLA